MVSLAPQNPSGNRSSVGRAPAAPPPQAPLSASLDPELVRLSQKGDVASIDALRNILESQSEPLDRKVGAVEAFCFVRRSEMDSAPGLATGERAAFQNFVGAMVAFGIGLASEEGANNCSQSAAGRIRQQLTAQTSGPVAQAAAGHLAQLSDPAQISFAIALMAKPGAGAKWCVRDLSTLLFRPEVMDGVARHLGDQEVGKAQNVLTGAALARFSDAKSVSQLDLVRDLLVRFASDPEIARQLTSQLLDRTNLKRFSAAHYRVIRDVFEAPGSGKPDPDALQPLLRFRRSWEGVSELLHRFQAGMKGQYFKKKLQERSAAAIAALGNTGTKARPEISRFLVKSGPAYEAAVIALAGLHAEATKTICGWLKLRADHESHERKRRAIGAVQKRPRAEYADFLWRGAAFEGAPLADIGKALHAIATLSVEGTITRERLADTLSAKAAYGWDRHVAVVAVSDAKLLREYPRLAKALHGFLNHDPGANETRLFENVRNSALEALRLASA